MEEKSTSQQPKHCSNNAPSTDVGRDRFASILTPLFFMSEATNSWKVPCYLAYDIFDARLRSFFSWPKYMESSPAILSTAGFFMWVRIIFSPKYSQIEFIHDSILFISH